jgi:hypothetical protein
VKSSVVRFQAGRKARQGGEAQNEGSPVSFADRRGDCVVKAAQGGSKDEKSVVSRRRFYGWQD